MKYPKLNSLNFKNKDFFLGAGLIFIIILGIILRWQAMQEVVINDWAVRDFDRAFNIVDGEYLPLAGPELTNGGRLPGPFLYFLLALPLIFNYSYKSIFVFNFLINASSVVGFYFVLRKHFDLFFSILATALLANNLQHIGAVYFPINPSLICPISVLFLFFLLGFFLDKSQKAFVFLILILSLAIQVHYQILTYLSVVFFIAMFLKQGIPFKTAFKSLVIAALCFIPYLIYKHQSFVPSYPNPVIMKLNTGSWKFSEIIKVVTIHNTIARISHSQRFEGNGVLPLWIKKLHNLGLSISFYGLVLVMLLKSLNPTGHTVDPKDKIVLSLFYFPSLCFELLNPPGNHYWYNYIFIVPQVLVISRFIVLLSNSIQNRYINTGGLSFAIIILIGSSISAFHFTSRFSKNFKTELGSHYNQAPYLSNGSISYENSNLLLKQLMNELNLTPRELYEQVYFLGFYPLGLRKIEASAETTDNKYKRFKKNLKQTQRMICYFIMDPTHFDPSLSKKYLLDFDLKKFRYAMFKSDKTIRNLETRTFIFSKEGIQKKFHVHRYTPIQNQSCYNNTFNPWVTTKSLLNLLHEAKSLKSDYSIKTNFKTISTRENYDSKGELDSFEGNFIILNNFINLPLRLNLKVKKEKTTYSLKGTLDFIIFFGNAIITTPANLGSIDLLLYVPKTPHELPNENNILNKSLRLEIFPKNTIASSYNFVMGPHMWNYNQKWYRKLFLPPEIKLRKDNFFISLFWGPISPNQQFNILQNGSNLAILAHLK